MLGMARGSGEEEQGEADRGEKGLIRPENRMLLMPYFTILVPIGFFWYGWSVEAAVHWIRPIIGTAPIGIGSMWAMVRASLLRMTLILCCKFRAMRSALRASALPG